MTKTEYNLTPELRERVAALVAALRSGEYKQDRGYLRTKRGYCCLGVACDLYSKIPGNPAWEVEMGLYSYDSHVGVLPYDVADHFGMPCELGFIIGGVVTLADMNDGGASFAEIADAIERDVLGVRGE